MFEIRKTRIDFLLLVIKFVSHFIYFLANSFYSSELTRKFLSIENCRAKIRSWVIFYDLKFQALYIAWIISLACWRENIDKWIRNNLKQNRSRQLGWQRIKSRVPSRWLIWWAGSLVSQRLVRALSESYWGLIKL